jgi:hypothetical protein
MSIPTDDYLRKLLESMDFKDIEQRIVEQMNPELFALRDLQDEEQGIIRMRQNKNGVWEKEKSYASRVYVRDADDGGYEFVGTGEVLGVDYAGASPSFTIVDECGPVPDDLRDGKVFPFKGRTPMAERTPIRAESGTVAWRTRCTDHRRRTSTGRTIRSTSFKSDKK